MKNTENHAYTHKSTHNNLYSPPKHSKNRKYGYELTLGCCFRSWMKIEKDLGPRSLLERRSSNSKKF